MERRRVWSGGECPDFGHMCRAVLLSLEGAHPPAILPDFGSASGERRMRAFAAIAVLSLLPGLAPAADKLTFEDRVELTRGLMAEYGTVKVLLPRSRKALEYDSNGTYNKKEWEAIARESGPAARTGDMVQITKIDIEADRIVLQINGGYKGGRKWYSGVQISGTMGQQVPVGQNSDVNAPGGTSVAILF